MILAPNFTLRELTRTTHRRYAEQNHADALGTPTVLSALTAVASMLQRIRDHFGAPVIVHSGYRCGPLNRAIGGSKRSQHMKGQAADFHVYGVPLDVVFDYVRGWAASEFGQAILEGRVAGQPTWLHLSLGPPWRRLSRSGQCLTYDRTNGYRVAQ